LIDLRRGKNLRIRNAWVRGFEFSLRTSHPSKKIQRFLPEAGMLTETEKA
jgi:hypothetical protein